MNADERAREPLFAKDSAAHDHMNVSELREALPATHRSGPIVPQDAYANELLGPDDKNVADIGEEESGGSESEDDSEKGYAAQPPNPNIQAVSMWTRKEIAEFKESIKNESAEGIIKVGNGEVVTVRVPTHPEGNSLFWEFATDSYDIAFGVLFEWTKSESNAVTVVISESSDEDEELEEQAANAHDVENTAGNTNARRKPPYDEVEPIYRRDCHLEVFAGSHQYPGQGTYLLKFDNSYSLWRSKTLYYRVYYSQ